MDSCSDGIPQMGVLYIMWTHCVTGQYKQVTSKLISPCSFKGAEGLGRVDTGAWAINPAEENNTSFSMPIFRVSKNKASNNTMQNVKHGEKQCNSPALG